MKTEVASNYFSVPPCLCERSFRKYSFLLFFVFAVFFSGCSSAPKKPAEIYTDRIFAANQLNLASQAAHRGRYQDALFLLEEARRLALSTDDPELRLKTSIAKGNILFSLGRRDEALAELESATAEGDASGEHVLAALSRIYTIRAKLRALEEGGRNDAAVEELKTALAREMVVVKSDSPAVAAGYVTQGMAEKLLGHWVEAESAVKKALDIHDKGRYLEDAAYDWFLIASVRSVAGNYESALEALKQAIHFDRKAENGFGLASSWQAMGDVYQKAGKAEESRTAYRRAADIYRAIYLPERAEKLEQQF